MKKYRVPVPPPPTEKYKIIVELVGKEFEVEPEKIPYGRHGIPGSILDTISTADEALIEHACGGVQACSTCHIIIAKGFDSCNEISDREDDYLEQTPGLTLESRLACCCVPDGSEDIIIRIPSWNRNEVKE